MDTVAAEQSGLLQSKPKQTTAALALGRSVLLQLVERAPGIGEQPPAKGHTPGLDILRRAQKEDDVRQEGACDAHRPAVDRCLAAGRRGARRWRDDVLESRS